MKKSRSGAKNSGAALSRPDSAGLAAVADSVSQLKISASRGELVAIIGTGVSMSLTNGALPVLSWKGLIEDGFANVVQKGKITAAQAETWKTHLDSSDLDELLGAAEFVGRKLETPRGDLYARWLQNAFEHVQPANKKMERAVRGLIAAGIPLGTLNYDTLLERVTGLPTINLGETGKVTAWMRRESPGILHLHGSWDAPATCILGIRDYETTLGDDVRDLIQRSLASFRRLLFIGCGGTFADPNFSALIKWLRNKMKTAALQHYALVSSDELSKRHADPSWHGFVEPLSYGLGHGDLPAFLVKNFPAPKAAAERKKGAPDKAPTSANQRAAILENYREFLLKDCGQMTIEGVRADMDTAQRRFDLERLFVPLKVLPSPPDLPSSDPRREQKLLQWKEKNKEPLPFGKVFAKHQRLALLALPGGGKTLLLKRLAVAYTDRARREASGDALPDLELTPVLIRCREWREHIHRPVRTLLRNIADITGHAHLDGLLDALLPLFKEGRILLLVDGLDEIHDDALRSTFVEHLETFLDEFKRTRLVVTSREAGFSLVAPVLARFCERWRVAPLDEDAIHALCDHWHSLMVGSGPEVQKEARQVAEYLLQNNSLRRLAENPLLLTMLLVVKHGAGRLPPDRVSLYGRAVEVLLDTWNIKGHDPLNLKEAIPQLACVAFQLMRAGKQTATARELLTLLEEAREKVPQIRRYAKDTPDEFLKRVELRSSLLVEAGHQVEGARAVPFYQFRHLTFQEYLAGVAAAEGHYMEYDKRDSVLTPLASYLTNEKWKEVIPMAAVLARKQAEPLMATLVAEGNKLRGRMEARLDFEGKKAWLTFPPKLPAPVARLMQCLVEEAEADLETLAAALQLVAFFARACRTIDDWSVLSRGPYGEELAHQAWLLYAPMNWPQETRALESWVRILMLQRPRRYWEGSEGNTELQRLLSSQHVKDIARGLAIYTGLFLGPTARYGASKAAALLPSVETHLFQEDSAISTVAAWAWGGAQVAFGRGRAQPNRTGEQKDFGVAPSVAILDRLTTLLLGDIPEAAVNYVSRAFIAQFSIPRHAWTPVLTESQVQKIRRMATQSGINMNLAIVRVAFYGRNVWSDEELVKRLLAIRKRLIPPDLKVVAIDMLEQLGEKAAAPKSSK